MKIIVFGCQQIALDFIKYLNERDDIQLELVFTYELPMDAIYGYSSVIDYCKENNIEYSNNFGNKIINKIKDSNPDIIFSIYYRKILSKEILNIPRLGCINIHPSLLPYYRGPAPTAWALLNNEKEVGLTIHYMDEGIDAGEILVQKKVPIHPDETGFELYDKCMSIGAELLISNFDDLINQDISSKPQIGRGSYYGKFIGKPIINWKDSTQKIINQIRASAKPYNVCETILLNKYMFINRAKNFDSDIPLQGPGIIKDVIDDSKIVVSCVDGYILLEDYEIYPAIPENEKEFYIKIGNRFG